MATPTSLPHGVLHSPALFDETPVFMVGEEVVTRADMYCAMLASLKEETDLPEGASPAPPVVPVGSTVEEKEEAVKEPCRHRLDVGIREFPYPHGEDPPLFYQSKEPVMGRDGQQVFIPEPVEGNPSPFSAYMHTNTQVQGMFQGHPVWVINKHIVPTCPEDYVFIRTPMEDGTDACMVVPDLSLIEFPQPDAKAMVKYVEQEEQEQEQGGQGGGQLVKFDANQAITPFQTAQQGMVLPPAQPYMEDTVTIPQAQVRVANMSATKRSVLASSAKNANRMPQAVFLAQQTSFDEERSKWRNDATATVSTSPNPTFANYHHQTMAVEQRKNAIDLWLSKNVNCFNAQHLETTTKAVTGLLGQGQSVPPHQYLHRLMEEMLTYCGLNSYEVKRSMVEYMNARITAENRAKAMQRTTNIAFDPNNSYEEYKRCWKELKKSQKREQEAQQQLAQAQMALAMAQQQQQAWQGWQG